MGMVMLFGGNARECDLRTEPTHADILLLVITYHVFDPPRSSASLLRIWMMLMTSRRKARLLRHTEVGAYYSSSGGLVPRLLRLHCD